MVSRCTILAAGALALSACGGSDVETGAQGTTPKQASINLYKRITEIARDCDASAKKLAGFLEAQDVVASYRAADQVEGVCYTASQTTAEVTVPDALESEAENTGKIIGDCKSMFSIRARSARQLKEVLDGDTRTSALASVQDNANDLELAQTTCLLGLIEAATRHGATPAELGLEQPKSGAERKP